MASFSILPPKPSWIHSLNSLEISTGRITVNPYNYKSVTISNSGRGGRRSSALRAAAQAGGGGSADGTSVGPSAGDVPAPAAAKSGGFSLFNLPPWSNLIFGSFFISAIPIYRRMKMAQETLEKTLEDVTEVVEKAAEKTDKVAEELAASLPQGQLRDVVVKIEKIAEKVDEKAEAAHEIIEKVDEFTDKLEEIVEEEILVNIDSDGDLKSKS